jgi:hypothetical protein
MDEPIEGGSMLTHAEYMRQWRTRRRPQRVPDLNWPTNLFGHPYNIDELLAQALQQQRPMHDDKCPCGCGTTTSRT